MTIPFLYPQTVFKLTKMYRAEQRAKVVLDDFQRDVLRIRRGVVWHNNNDDEKETSNPVDLLIFNEQKFSYDEIRDHILTIMSGYETAANAMSHIMLLLAMHPEVQEKILDELKAKNLTEEDMHRSDIVDNLEYLEMVMKETSRLLPPVPMVLREIVEDLEMEPGLVIPKGVVLIINFFGLHRRKDIWGENSEKFDPERFSYENSKGRHPFAHIPFAFGSRVCIAARFSNIFLKIAIIKLVQNFRFSTSMKMTDIRLKSYISLKLCSPHLLRVEKR